MFEIFKTPLAEANLKHIWLYSFEIWGEAQADRYLEQIEAGIRRLVENPRLGKPRENIRAGYRSIQINRHVAYYRMEGQRIEIVRVLHESMDPWKHLEE